MPTCKHSRRYLHAHTCECKHAKQHTVPNRGRFHAAAPRPKTHHVWRRLDFNLRTHTPQGEDAHHLEFALRARTRRRCRNRLPPTLRIYERLPSVSLHRLARMSATTLPRSDICCNLPMTVFPEQLQSVVRRLKMWNMNLRSHLQLACRSSLSFIRHRL
jgi:hypothetical protein